MNALHSRRASILTAGAAALTAVLAFPALLRAADEPAKAAAPTFCVVRGDKIADPAKAAGKAVVGGKTYYLCCAGCVAKFDKSDDAAKTKFAKVTDLRTEKAVLQERLKAVDAELNALEGKKPAAAAPAAAAAATKTAASALQCAVTGEEIASVADATGGKTVHNGKTYYFCCPGCKTKFDGDKAKFAAEADKRNAGI
ncbi:MAG TPA: YHS domain-containing protein [Armatimonadaceae bacterium]|nr:YHS domain-containing protein [Armatimonadaceae bacterium]